MSPQTNALKVGLALLLSFGYVFGLGSRYMETAQFPQMNFENCMSTLEISQLGISVVIGWTLNPDNTTIDFAMAATTGGWVAFGMSLVNNTGMVNSDAIIGYIPGTGGVPTLDDYFINVQQTPCTGNTLGVCTDVQRGNTNNLANISGSEINGVTVLSWTRALNTGDPDDTPILDRTWEYFSALHISEEGVPGSIHTYRSIPLQFNLFQTPACPVGLGNQECSGPTSGTCSQNGCCVCQTGFDGPACDRQVAATTTNPDPNGVPTQIDPDDYDFSAELSSDFRIFWSIEDDSLLLAMECSGTGWCSFGPSNNDLMTDSDVIYGFVTNDGTVSVSDRWINDRSSDCPGICEDTDSFVNGENSLLAANGAEVNGNTQIIFRRLLDTGDTVGDIVITDRMMDAVFASNPNSDGFSRHGPAPSDAANRIRINFFTGEVSLANDYRLAHGLLMFFAWGLIVPLTSCVARYGKKYKIWFPTHWCCNSLALLMILAAFILIVLGTTVHFSRTHHILGIVIVFGALVQVGLGVVSHFMYNPDREQVPCFPDKSHWFCGFFLLLIALINILLGLIEFDAPLYLSSLYIIWASMTLIISVAVGIVVSTYQVYHPVSQKEDEGL